MIPGRDSKGRFLKGVTPEGAVPINEGMAKEYQARSVQSRREHKALAEVVRDALEKKMGDGTMTRLEYIAEKAILNHSKGEMTFKDLRDLQKVLGEDVLNIETNGPQVIVVSQKAVEAAKKWSK